MEIFATIVMLAWIPTVLLMFAVFPPRRAVIVSFLSAWLFLPVITLPIPLFPDYSKMSATCAGIFIGALIFDAKTVLQFKAHWVDVPILIYCLCPLPASVTNGLGMYDGVSRVVYQILTWGLPYLIGRCYFTNSETHRELAISIIIGGLAYVPLCLAETRLSPIFHKMFYGYFPRGVQKRFGGWRPSVFMDSGLTLGMWMAAVSLIAIWLWRAGAFKKLWGVSTTWYVWTLLLTTILCRATGALALLVVGLGALWVTRHMRTRIALACLMALPVAYITLRLSGAWHGGGIIEMARLVNEDRARSFQFRIKNEDLLIDKAKQKPLFGWGGWGRGRVYDEDHRDLTVTDGRWVIDVGAYGFVGLSAYFGVLLLPPALLVRRFSTRRLTGVDLAPTVAMAVIGLLYAIDSIPNAMANPLFMLTTGAVASVAVTRQPVRGAARARNEGAGEASRIAESVPPRRLFPGSTASV